MKPLSGITVLDFTQFTSGPVATYILADMGADVYKLENPPYGDHNHYNIPSKNKHTMYITSLNHNKKSMLLNMKNPEHKEFFLKMVQTADVVVDNFKAGTLEKFGITYDLLKETNPRIIWASVSGYGQTGPWARRPAVDMTIQALSGIVTATGDVGSSGVKAAISMADYTAGLNACIGIMASFIDAKRSGTGRRVDLGMLDSAFSLMEQQVTRYFRNGEICAPFGREDRSFAPSNSFICRDGREILISVRTDEQFGKLCEALEETVPEAFGTNRMRVADRDGVNAFVGKMTGKYDYEELYRRLDAGDIPHGRISRLNEVEEDAQCLKRSMIRSGKYKDGTECSIVGNPIKFMGDPEEEPVSFCFLGEDTVEIASKYIGPEKAHEMFDGVVSDSAEKWTARTSAMK